MGGGSEGAKKRDKPMKNLESYWKLFRFLRYLALIVGAILLLLLSIKAYSFGHPLELELNHLRIEEDLQAFVPDYYQTEEEFLNDVEDAIYATTEHGGDDGLNS